MTEKDLPKEFAAFEELIFCSNILENCKIPIAIDDRPIILVGKGKQPQIWLWVRAAQTTKDSTQIVLAQIVSSNSVRIPVGSITVDTVDNCTYVKIKDVVIIKAVRHSEEKATIEQIDLRPLGFSVHGDSKALGVGNTIMADNRITGTRVAIALG